MFRGAVAFIAVLGFTPITTAQTSQWICVGDKTTGFAYSNSTQSWVPSNFSNPEDKKYIFRIRRDGEYVSSFGRSNTDWVALRIGSDNPFSCFDRIVETDNMIPALRSLYGPTNHIALDCNNGLSEVQFRSASKRFMSFLKSGYILGNDTESDTPTITIGRCSPF